MQLIFYPKRAVHHFRFLPVLRMATTADPPDGGPGGGDYEDRGGGEDDQENPLQEQNRSANEANPLQEVDQSKNKETGQSTNKEKSQSTNKENNQSTNKEDNQSKNKENNRASNEAKQLSYADRLKTNVRFDQRLKRNVLEISLEKRCILIQKKGQMKSTSTPMEVFHHLSDPSR